MEIHLFIRFFLIVSQLNINNELGYNIIIILA